MGEWTIKDILNDQDNQGQSLLHLAVDVGRYKTCRLLIDKEPISTYVAVVLSHRFILRQRQGI